MAVRRGTRWALIASGALLLVIVAALFVAPPFVVRHALQNYLTDQGISADIGSVHADIFSGQITLDDVSGHGPDDRGFRIGHLALDIDYWPLTDHHIELSSVELSAARVDVGRNADRQFTVAGVPILAGTDGQTNDWGVGVGSISARNVTLHYREPRRPDQPAVDQTLGIDKLHIGAIATWQRSQSIDVSARLRVAKGQLALDGQISPFGPNRRADFTIKASDFAMKALSPLARLGRITALDGTFDADQKLSIRYGAKGGLTANLKGQSSWRNAHLAAADGTEVRSDKLSWQGEEQARLWPGNQQPGRITASGKAALSNVVARRADQLDFTQKSATWNGKVEAELGATATRVTSHGKLTAHKTRLTSGDWLKLSSGTKHFTGDLNLIRTRDETRIETDGGLTASAMSFAVPGAIDLGSASLDWNGKASTRLTAHGTHIQTNGALTGNQLVFDIPEISQVTADRVDWKGSMRMHSADLVARSADGRLDASNVKLNIPGAPIHMSAARFGFNGQYAAQPSTADKALRLTLSGDAYSRKLAVVDTTIKAPWIDLLQADASDIDIDSLNSIRLGALKASGIRILGDTDTNSAVIQAVSMKASQFSLRDLSHYGLHDLELDGAIIHTRRDAGGMGVISQFVDSVTGRANATAGNSAQTGASQSSASTGANRSSATYAVDHLHLSGPAIAFVDTTTTPNVKLTGSNLDFTLDHLDTTKPDQNASYKLGLDVGAYGHFNSLGKIAPFAAGGIRMDLDAWLRSLALAPMSGYLNAAMNRRIANGVADGTLKLSATKGQLNGVLDTTVTNFRLADSATKKTDIAYGISMNTALKLIRGQDDIIHLRTKILGDATNPYFSIDNLVREALLAGLRTALLSNYSPIGLLNKAKNSFLNLFRSIQDYPVTFPPGMHYIRPENRKLLALIAKAMREHPGWTLHVVGQAVPTDARALRLDAKSADTRHARLKQLARQRQESVSDYLTARNVNPARIIAGEPSVATSDDAKPAVRFSLDKK